MLLERFSGFELIGSSDDLDYAQSFFLRGLKRLDVRLGAAAE